MGLLAVGALAMGSCSKNLIIATRAVSPGIDSTHKYVFSNDTVRIEYDFWWKGGYMQYTVYNKLPIPLFVDWKNSSFIDDGAISPYWSDKTTTRSTGSAVTVSGVSFGSGHSIAEKSERVHFIPAGTQLVKRIAVAPLPRRSKKKWQQDWERRKGVTLRNFLAFALNDDEHAKEFYVSNAFRLESAERVKRRFLPARQNPKYFYLKVKQ